MGNILTTIRPEDIIEFLVPINKALAAAREKWRHVWDDSGFINKLSLAEKGLKTLDESTSLPGQESQKWGLALADWVVCYEFEVLQGFGSTFWDLKSGEVEGARALATTWGVALGKLLAQVLRFSLVCGVGDIIISIVQQMPIEALREGIYRTATPDYFKQMALLNYSLAVFEGDTAKAMKAKCTLENSYTELQEEINHSFPSTEQCKEMKAQIVGLLTEAFNLLKGRDVKEEFIRRAPGYFKGVAWYLGFNFSRQVNSNPERLRPILDFLGGNAEVKAAMQTIRHKHAWEGDRDKVAFIVWQEYAPKVKHYKKLPSVEKISENGDESMLIGFDKGIRGYIKPRAAIDVLVGISQGEMRRYVTKAGKNERASQQRMMNKQRGVKPPTEWWSQEGKTEGEIRKRVTKEIEDLKGQEIPASDFEGSDRSITDVLEQAAERQAFDQWQEERRSFIKEELELEELCKQTTLTPRQQLVKKLYDKPDEEVALALFKKFHKPVKPGAVRKLRHALRNKLKKVANK